MVNQEPESGRCNARVTSPVGFELIDTTDADPDGPYSPDRDNETRLLDDDDILLVRATSADGTMIVEGPPVYEQFREYVADGYKCEAVAVTAEGADVLREELGAEVRATRPATDQEALPRDTMYTTAGSLPDLDDPIWVDLHDCSTRMSYRTTELDGFCERWPSGGDAERCYNHQGPSGNPEHLPDDNGADQLTHGIYAKRTNYWTAMDDDERRFVEEMVDSWLDDAPFTRSSLGKLNDLYRAAIDQHRAWNGVDELVTEDGEIQGMVIEEPMMDEDGAPVIGEDGDVVTVSDEHPANLPLSRLDRDVTKKLKELGILSDPESQKAEATESLAQKLSGDDE